MTAKDLTCTNIQLKEQRAKPFSPTAFATIAPLTSGVISHTKEVPAGVHLAAIE